MLRKQREEEGEEGAIVEIEEGVADHQPQRPRSSLKESLFMVQRSALIQLFFVSITVQRGGLVPWTLKE